MPRITHIKFQVSLDDDHVPESILWKAEESENKEYSEIKAMLVSLFDKDSKDTLKLDLWTKDMQVHEMDMFMHRTLLALGETYLKATNNQKLADAFSDFSKYFGEETKILSTSN